MKPKVHFLLNGIDACRLTTQHGYRGNAVITEDLSHVTCKLCYARATGVYSDPSKPKIKKPRQIIVKAYYNFNDKYLHEKTILQQRTPQEWEEILETITDRTKPIVASIVWWDWLAETGFNGFHKYLTICPNVTDERIAESLVKVGYPQEWARIRALDKNRGREFL